MLADDTLASYSARWQAQRDEDVEHFAFAKTIVQKSRVIAPTPSERKRLFPQPDGAGLHLVVRPSASPGGCPAVVAEATPVDFDLFVMSK